MTLAFNPIGLGKTKGKKCEEVVKKCAEQEVKVKKGMLEPNAAESLSEMFRKNKTLMHCDFSHWDLSLYECKIINQGLNQNHTVLGLHMVGNEMNTDPLGFLKPAQNDPGASHILPHISNKDIKVNKNNERADTNVTSNWWLCEGWIQTEFEFDPIKSNKLDNKELGDRDIILIHLSFEDYEPDLLIKDPKSGIYKITRMVRIDFYDLIY